jgi:uncharacterized protein YacL
MILGIPMDKRDVLYIVLISFLETVYCEFIYYSEKFPIIYSHILAVVGVPVIVLISMFLFNATFSFMNVLLTMLFVLAITGIMISINFFKANQEAKEINQLIKKNKQKKNLEDK